MKLDHATIVTRDIAAMRRFFHDVAGLDAGPRPAFGVGGCWLYADGQPLIHLIEGTAAAPAGPASPRIDHFALRVDGREAWAALIERLRLNRMPYELNEVPAVGELQLFVSMAPSVTIEFVTRPQQASGPARLSIRSSSSDQ